MIGSEAIGEVAIGEMSDGESTPLVYEPVSRIIAGGFSNGRPAQVAVLGALLIWDNGDYIAWDNGDFISWES